MVLLDRDSEALDVVSSELMARHAGPVAQVLADLSTLEGIYAAASELTVRSDLTLS